MKKPLLNSKTLLIAVIASFGFCNSAKADWTVINNGLTDKTSNDISNNGTAVVDATETGIFYTLNNGTSWTAVSGTQYAKAVVTIGTTFYAAVQDGANGVMKSTDNGATWTAVNTGLLYKYNDALAVDGSNLYADDFGNTYVSSNGGTNWSAVSTLPGFSSIVRNGTTLCAGYSIGGNGYNGIYISTDNGATWSQPSNTGLTEKVHQLAVIGTTLFATTGTAVYTSINNGTSWTAHTSVGNSVALAVYGTNLFVGTPGGTFLSTDMGVTYTNISGIMGIESDVCLTIMGSDVYAGTAYNTHGVYHRALSEMVTVGINTVKKEIAIETYPNPSNSIVNFKAGSNNEITSIKLTNMIGSEVKEAEFKIAGDKALLNVNNLNDGVYFVEMITVEGIMTKKIVVSK
ncbi:MAG: T9SS type A sorting domain-containing protein [Bacteroidia bacterium]